MPDYDSTSEPGEAPGPPGRLESTPSRSFQDVEGDSSHHDSLRLNSGLRGHSGRHQNLSTSSVLDIQNVAKPQEFRRSDKLVSTTHAEETGSGSSYSIPSTEEGLRQKYALRPGPISLRSLPDPQPGRRPLYPYAVLALLAIHGSPERRLRLEQIYDAVEERFEYYRNQPTGAWKVSHCAFPSALFPQFLSVGCHSAEPKRGSNFQKRSPVLN